MGVWQPCGNPSRSPCSTAADKGVQLRAAGNQRGAVALDRQPASTGQRVNAGTRAVEVFSDAVRAAQPTVLNGFGLSLCDQLGRPFDD